MACYCTTGMATTGNLRLPIHILHYANQGLLSLKG